MTQKSKRQSTSTEHYICVCGVPSCVKTDDEIKKTAENHNQVI